MVYSTFALDFPLVTYFHVSPAKTKEEPIKTKRQLAENL